MAPPAVLKKSGVIYGQDVKDLFDYAQEKGFAIPAINVTSSSTVVAALEAARDNKAPIILQTSQGGAAYFAGKGVDNKDQAASIAGSIAAAHYIRSIAPAYGIPVVLHTDHCAKKLLPWFDGMLKADEEFFAATELHCSLPICWIYSKKSMMKTLPLVLNISKEMSKMNQWLEMEIGITGGERSGVNNEHVEKDALYTSPETVFAVYKALQPISPNFSIAAAFGNVHGVYKPGNVQLRPEILGDHQKFAKKELSSESAHPLYLVFHGGSGSTQQEFDTAIKNGVVKVNLDTDCQFAYLSGIRDYIVKNIEYLKTPVGNPEGADKPNKKKFDPRVWVREGEKTMSARIAEALDIFHTKDQL
ncbi:FBA1 Fructose-bisphosphate aldolase [Candida maltosa Xu316]